MSRVAGRVCVVTGAGSGIGRALAVELAGRGARLAICDVSEPGLAETRTLLGDAEVHVAVIDVSDREAVHAYAGEVAEHFSGVVHQLYNNAGVAFRRSIVDSEYADYERVLDVNLWGVIHGTKAFLPHLIASGDGHLVNVSSLNGYMTQPGMTHYCTSKFAVRGFTEAVRADMLAGGHPVGVTCVHPGGIRTNIAAAALENAKTLGLPFTAADERRQQIYDKKLLKMDPARAATIVVDGVERNRPRVLVGRDARLVDAFVRLLPARHVPLSVAFDERLAR
jgi:NAD(P)-dependent dehydrogenase (short-subunit alcohol dehydrogenase family)